MKKCQFCAEEVQDEAIVCKHCGSDLNAPTPRRMPAVQGEIENKIRLYLSYDYELVSKTNTDAVMERRSPINAFIMIAAIILFWPAAIIYAIPGVRKMYRVQLNVQTNGRVDELGGNIMMLERDKKRAKTNGIVLLVFAVFFIIAMVSGL